MVGKRGSAVRQIPEIDRKADIPGPQRIAAAAKFAPRIAALRDGGHRKGPGALDPDCVVRAAIEFQERIAMRRCHGRGRALAQGTCVPRELAAPEQRSSSSADSNGASAKVVTMPGAPWQCWPQPRRGAVLDDARWPVIPRWSAKRCSRALRDGAGDLHALVGLQPVPARSSGSCFRHNHAPGPALLVASVEIWVQSGPRPVSSRSDRSRATCVSNRARQRGSSSSRACECRRASSRHAPHQFADRKRVFMSAPAINRVGEGRRAAQPHHGKRRSEVAEQQQHAPNSLLGKFRPVSLDQAR